MFISDNTAPACSEVFDYLQQHLQTEFDAPYGDDQQTAQLDAAVSEIFGRPVKVFPVLSGTASNCLALSSMCSSVGAIVAHRDSHLSVSENTAPHFFTGGAALHTIGLGPDLIMPEELSAYCEQVSWQDVHSAVPRVLSVTQSSELGRVYSAEHLQELSEITRHYGLSIFLDGARFGNAVAALNCSAASISCDAGVDAMTFGAIKNGTFGAEALVLFNLDLYPAVRQKAKQAGHLASKMRYLSAQLMAYFSDGLWLKNAVNANLQAKAISEMLAQAGFTMDVEQQTNQLFFNIPVELHSHLADHGFDLYPWPVNEKASYRLVTNWSTTQKDVDAFGSALSSWSANEHKHK